MKKGFTLIELLVVVLIIGILAAIAVPKYQLAVMKARFSSMMPTVRALAEAQEIYYMQNGEYALLFSDLSIEIPHNGETLETNRLCKQEYCCYLQTSGYVWCSGDKTGYYAQYLPNSSYPDKRYCVTYSDGNESAGVKMREKLCASYAPISSRPAGNWTFWELP